MKILHITTGLDAGGAERIMVDLAIAQAARGHEVRVASMLGDGHFTAPLRDAGIDVDDLGFRRGAFPARAALDTVRRVRSFQPDVVHTSLLHANIIGRVTRVLAPVPVVVSTIQNIDERGNQTRSSWRSSARLSLYRLTDRLADLTSQVSEAGAADYVQRRLVSRGRMIYVPNATDTVRFRRDALARATGREALGLRPDDHLFLNVGSLHPQKAQARLIETFADTFGSADHRHLVIVGDGPLRERLERIVEDRGVGHTVRLVGLRTDLTTLLNAADTFVLPSDFEGMPLALLEAMACERPSICTDVGGVGAVATNGRTGYVIPKSDSAALSLAMTAAATLTDAERASMGRAARADVVDQFSLDAITEFWLDLYERVSTHRSRSRIGRPSARWAAPLRSGNSPRTPPPTP